MHAMTHHPAVETSKSHLLFRPHEPQWSDTTWSTGTSGGPSEHAVSAPIMVGNPRRSNSFIGPDGDRGPVMLSPRSTDTGGLGVKMVEYVLGERTSPKD